MRILVVDDHPVLLDGTKMLLESVEGWHVATLADVTTILQKIELLAPDLLLLDINLGEMSGITIAEQVKQTHHTPIVLYSGYNIEDYYDLLLHGKIDGLLSKTAERDVVIQTIQATLRGDVYVPRSFLQYAQQKNIAQPAHYSFTERELYILQAVSNGDTNKAIAAQLQLSQRSVENDLTKIFSKLGVDSRAQAVSKAKDMQLIK